MDGKVTGESQLTGSDFYQFNLDFKDHRDGIRVLPKIWW